MPNLTIATIILIGSFILFIALRFPIAYSLGIASVVTVMYLKMPVEMVAQNTVRGINAFSLMAVPFFIISGELMSQGGIANRLVNLANAMVGWMRGGLAVVNIVASMFFGGISGSSAADTASLGPILIPMMNKQGYDNEFSTGITCASSVQGMLIPPSHNMVIYAMVAGSVSVGALFLAGLVPGILLGVFLLIYSLYMSKKKNYPKGDAFNFRNVLVALKDSIFGLITVLIVVVGVIGGFFTATEAAGLSVVWAFIVTFFIYKEIPLKKFWDILGTSLRTISMVMIIIGTSAAFGWLLAFLKVPEMVAGGILTLTTNKILVLLIINAILFVFGMFMDMAAIITITTPILLPIAMQVGMDPVHYGAMMVLNLGIGVLTPPVGNTLFIGSAISGLKIERLAKSMIPMYIVMVATLMVITYFPSVVMTLPKLLMN
ncbi:TRAP transporter large permease [Proteiniclasticum sp. SCR006]|uniref:TRAP transporter large permease n=1 Tax=Proteiniclasticum aestuarii TaxID=2817862 RepID=A0A939KG54_9CLOT|nr:TRAP transporter large permease [Proteiniclasticum aestuarii]MBO1264029.1 TRAP transporter large permease [Proteiniclasticum aestuarii]